MFKIPVNILKSKPTYLFSKIPFSCSPHASVLCKQPKDVCVTVVGATTKMGQMLALMLKQCPYIDELRLYSPKEAACGIALDLAQIDTNTRVKAYFGVDLLNEAIQDVQVIAVCCNLPVAPICEAEYLEKIGYIVKNYATFASEVNPNAIFCIGCPPTNSLVPLVSEEYERAGVYDHRKIMGVSMVACSIANSVLACNTGNDACKVRMPVLGGLCSDTIVPIISQSQPKVTIPPDILDLIYSKIQTTGDKILEEKCKEGTGECYMLYAFASSRFITSILKGLKGVEDVFECAYIRQIGHIGEFLPYMSSLVKLGKDGIAESYMPTVSTHECQLLQDAAKILKQSINLGKSFVTGECPKQPKRIPYTPPTCSPPNLDCYVVKAKFLRDRSDPCGKTKKTVAKDPNLMKKKQRAIKVRLEKMERANYPKRPSKYDRKFCKNEE